MTNQRLDDAVLEAFMHKFYGYGNLDSDYWFIGMEEGFNDPKQFFNEMNRRISQWHLRGEQTVEDLAGYHRAIGIDKPFDDGAGLQRTWLGLMHIFHAAKGSVPNNQALKKYQATKLGSKSGDLCLLELFPLPSPSIDYWHHYKEHSNIDWLENRDTYKEHLREHRTAGIKYLIQKHQPKFVVFYGRGYKDTWLEIAGAGAWGNAIQLDQEAKYQPEINTTSVEGITFVSMPHVTAHGWTHKMFGALGRQLQK